MCPGWGRGSLGFPASREGFPLRRDSVPASSAVLRAYLYRQGNFVRVGLYENDIATLIHAYRPDLDVVFVVLAHYLSASDIAALRDIVAEIQQRIARFQHGFGEKI